MARTPGRANAPRNEPLPFGSHGRKTGDELIWRYFFEAPGAYESIQGITSGTVTRARRAAIESTFLPSLSWPGQRSAKHWRSMRPTCSHQFLFEDSPSTQKHMTTGGKAKTVLQTLRQHRSGCVTARGFIVTTTVMFVPEMVPVAAGRRSLTTLGLLLPAVPCLFE